MTSRLRTYLLQGLLSVAGGILLSIAFLIPSPVAGALVAPVAIVPWILLFAPRGLRAPAWLVLPGAYLFAILATGDLLRHSPIFGALAPLLFIPLILPFSILLRRLPDWRWLPGWLLVPVVWVGTEWIRVTYSPGSLEAYLLGHSVYGLTALIQVADLVGSYGVSLLVAAVNSAIAWEIIERFERLRGVEGGGWRERGWRLGLLCGLVIASLAYGLHSMSELRLEEGPRVFGVRIGEDRLVPDDWPEQEKRYAEQTLRTVPRRGEVDLLVWPQAAIPSALNADPESMRDLAFLGDRFDCPILVGARGPSKRYRNVLRNVAALIGARGQPAGVYEQMRLVPWLDVAPLELQLRRLRPEWAESVREATRPLLGATPRLEPGSEVVTFELEGGLSCAAPLGLEVMSNRWCREAKEMDVSFLVSLGRRRFGGRSSAVLMAATFRAIENRLSIARVEEAGLSFLIDPAGRLLRTSANPGPVEEAFQVAVPIPLSMTSGTSWGGEILGRCAAALVAVLLLWVLLPRRPAPRAEGPPPAPGGGNASR